MTLPAKDGIPEIACQQILLQDGSVYSVQWLELPQRCAGRVTGRYLLTRYLKLVRDCTLSLVRPVVSPDGIEFRLLESSLAFLRFAPPEFLCGPAGEAVHLRTVGGLLVREGEDPGTGKFSFVSEIGEAGVRVTVQLFYSRPLLLGSARPSWLRRLLFRCTQGLIHRKLTVRFLSNLYRELTGDRGRTRVKQVRVKEGRDI